MYSNKNPSHSNYYFFNNSISKITEIFLRVFVVHLWSLCRNTLVARNHVLFLWGIIIRVRAHTHFINKSLCQTLPWRGGHKRQVIVDLCKSTQVD